MTLRKQFDPEIGALVGESEGLMGDMDKFLCLIFWCYLLCEVRYLLGLGLSLSTVSLGVGEVDVCFFLFDYMKSKQHLSPSRQTYYL